MSHDGFETAGGECSGNSRCARITGELGYGTTAAENVAYRSEPLDQQVAATHTAWMESTRHKAHIMKPDHSAVGYGFYVCKDSEQGDSPVMYSTGLFGG